MTAGRRRLAPFLLLLVALLCVGAIALELEPGLPDGSGAATPASPRGLPTPPDRPAAPPSQPEQWAATALARPLFSRSRRPPAVAAASAPAAAAQPLPRVTGTFVTPAGRRAIFAAEGGGRPLVVQEGGRVGAYTVRSIEAGKVMVLGPDGASRTLGPSFDPNAPAPAPQAAGPSPGGPSPGAPGAPNLQGLLGVPGLGGPPGAASAGVPGLPGLVLAIPDAPPGVMQGLPSATPGPPQRPGRFQGTVPGPAR